jgi:hypothetical protein
MGSGTNAPVYDPQTVSTQQQGSNIQSAVAGQAASNVNQVTPYGTLTYQQTGVGPNGVPTYTATTNLSPAQQQLLQTLQGNQQTAGTQAGQVLSSANYGANAPPPVTALPTTLGSIPDVSPSALPTVGAVPEINPSALPSLPNLPTVSGLGDMTAGLTGQMLSKEVSYLNPFFTPQVDQLDAKLRNQGLAPGNPAYDQAMNALRQTQNQTVTGFLATAEPQAFQQALATQITPWQQQLQQEAQQYGQAQQTASTLHDQALQDALARYNTALQTGTVTHDQALQDALAQYQTALSTGTTQFGQRLTNYQLPLSIATQEFGLSQPGSLPSNLVSTPGAQVAPTNVVGAYNTAQQAAIQNAANQTAAQNAMISGLFSIPAALAGGYARSPTGSAQIGKLFG